VQRTADLTWRAGFDPLTVLPTVGSADGQTVVAHRGHVRRIDVDHQDWVASLGQMEGNRATDGSATDDGVGTWTTHWSCPSAAARAGNPPTRTNCSNQDTATGSTASSGAVPAVS
jgi:hypothetical protein